MPRQHADTGELADPAGQRRVAEERYSWELIVQRLLEVYEGVLAGGVKRPAPVEALTV